MERRLVVFFVLAFILTACSANQDSLSAEEFAAEAEAICDEAGQEIASLGFVTFQELLRVDEDGTHQQIATYMTGVAESVSSARERIAALTPRDPYAPLVDSFLSSVTEWEKVMATYLADLEAENVSNHPDILEQGHAVEAMIAATAREAGFPSCSQLQVP